MAAMTFQDLQNEVLAYGFDSTTYLSRVKRWLNEAQWKALRRVPLRELKVTATLSTTSGTSYVSLTAGNKTLRIVDVVYADSGDELQPVSLEWMDRLSVAIGTNAATGRPLYYCTDGTDPYAMKLQLWPVPNAVYSLVLRYYKEPAEMSANSDAPTIPDAHVDLLVNYAVSRAFRAEDDQERAAQFMAEYETGVRALADDRMREVPTGLKQVPGTWGHVRFDEPWDL